MSSPFMTTDDIIASAKRRASIPTNQSLFGIDDFIAFANEEMALGLVPMLMDMKQDYFVFQTTLPVILNQQAYELPDRAVGNKLRDLAYQDVNQNIYEMTRVLIDDIPFYNGPSTQNRIYSYYLQNNQFILVPVLTGQPTGQFILRYYMRPNQLVQSANVGIIKTINFATGDIGLDKAPPNYSTAAVYDFIQVKSPHKTLLIDQVPTAYSALTQTITFDPAIIPPNLMPGDRICLAYQSDIPQIPSDLHVVLAHRVAARCLEALGDTEGLQAANLKLAEFENKSQTLTDSRVESAPLKITNRHSTLRAGLLSRRYRFRA
jgi:hypothetical protein